MREFLISDFRLTNKESGLLSAFSILFDFSLVALFLSIVNQSGVVFNAPLSANNITISDNVSIFSESFASLSCVGFMVILYRSLSRLTDIPRLKWAKFLTLVGIVCGILYILAGKLALLVYGTESAPWVVDFLGVATGRFCFISMLVALVSVQLRLSLPLHRVSRRGFLSLTFGILLLVCVPFVGLMDVPEWVLTILLGGGFFCFMLAFALFVRMMSLRV